jgi:hypothetical protein
MAIATRQRTREFSYSVGDFVSLLRFSPTALASIDCRPIKMPSSLAEFLIFHNYFLIYRIGILGPIFQGFFEFRGHDIVVLVVVHVAHVDL